MTHTIKISQSELQKIVAKAVGDCEPGNVFFEVHEGQRDEIIVCATITRTEEKF